jgi:hypothetical protein
MAPTSGAGEKETVGLPAVGQPGDTCEQCGSALATDQRYCLNCGWRRGEARVDYQGRMLSGANGAQPVAVAQAPAASGFYQSPIFAVGTIALLGIMLLLGVLIGKDDNGGTQTVAATPATTTTASTPTDTTATTASTGKAAKAAAAGQGNVEKGGTGSTAGVATVDTQSLENAANSGQGAQAGKNLPDQVATGGDQESTDPEGIKNAGGGSGSTCIGC